MSMLEIWRQLVRQYSAPRRHPAYRGRNPADVLADPDMMPTRPCWGRTQMCPCGGPARPGGLYCGDDCTPSGGVDYTGWHPSHARRALPTGRWDR
jgi:hypothetical protein